MTKRLFLPLLLLLLASAAWAGKAKTGNPAFATTLYMYGLSASFNDTVVYITDVQEVDSAYLVSRKFLGGIREYVGQLDSHFRAKGDDKRTNTVFFCRTRKEAEKRYVKLRRRYTAPDISLQTLPTGEFTFHAVRPDVTPETPAPASKKSKKKGKDAVPAPQP